MPNLKPFSLLAPSEKIEAIQYYWNLPDTHRQEDMEILGRHTPFRASYYRRQPDEVVVKAILKLAQTPRSPWPTFHFLRAWLLGRHRAMLITFLDHLGVPHEQGLIEVEMPSPLEPDAYRRAAQVLREQGHGPHEMLVYFLTIHDGVTPFWEPLWPLIQDLQNEGPIPAESPAQLNPAPSEVPNLPVVPNPPSADQGPAPALKTAPEFLDDGATGPYYSDIHFTALEKAAIQAIIASAARLEDALSQADVRAMVDEILHLSTRPRLYLLKGYQGGVFLEPMEALGLVENLDRQGWYLVGFCLGTYRHGREKEILENFRGSQRVLGQLAQKASPWGVMLLGSFWELLLQVLPVTDFSKVLLVQGTAFHRDRMFRGVLQPLLERLSARYREGETAILPILEAMSKVMAVFRGEGMGDPPHLELEIRIHRRIGQCHQLLGHFAKAEETFHALLADGNFDTAGDLGLVEGRFQHLFDVPPPEDKTEWSKHLERLLQGESSYLQTVHLESPPINALFALGVLRFLQKDYPDAKKWLLAAETGMVQSPLQEVYLETHLLGWSRLLGAITIFETLDTSLLHVAEQMAYFALSNIPQRPKASLALLSQLVSTSAITDGVTMDRLAKMAFDKFGQTLWRHLGAEVSVLKSHEMRQALLEWLPNSKFSADRQYETLDKVLHLALGDEDAEQARELLGSLETLSMEHETLREKFLGLLHHSEKLDPAWSPLDVARSKSLLLNRSGRQMEAAEALVGEFYRLREQEDLLSRLQMTELLSFFRECHMEESRLQELTRGLPSPVPPDHRSRVQSLLEGGLTLHLLFVGGNETQAQYDRAVQMELRAKWPGVHVEFMHTGWTSNWSPFVDEVKRKLNHCHAIGLSYLIRTNFGRTVRALCSNEKPWFPCTGKGKESIQRTLETAAQWAAGKVQA